MNIPLIEGQFEAQEAIKIITKMIDVKIKHHEQKINNESTEEDVKRQEEKIKQLQKNLFEIRKYIEKNGNNITLSATLELNQSLN
jgi:hypothetical protein